MKVIVIALFLLVALDKKCNSSYLGKIYSKAAVQSFREQSAEDINSLYKYKAHLCRRLIVLPLTDAFNPNQASELHGKLEFSDKCSLPMSLGKLIFEKQYEVPWIFEVEKVPRDADFVSQSLESSSEVINIQKPKQCIAYCSPLDFRSLENYIFMPKWLMTTLGVEPNDIVDIRFVRIKLAALVVIEPLTVEWEQLVSSPGANPKQLLEHEINKFSSLTSDSIIHIEIKNVRYPLRIKKLIAEGGSEVRGVRIQDSDVRVDIDRTVVDSLLMRKKNDGR